MDYILLRREQKSTKSKEIKHDYSKDDLPKFIRVCGSYFRLRGEKYGDSHYWLDGGAWRIDFKIVGNELYTMHELEHLNNKLITPCTEEEWRVGNGRYAVDNP